MQFWLKPDFHFIVKTQKGTFVTHSKKYIYIRVDCLYQFLSLYKIVASCDHGNLKQINAMIKSQRSKAKTIGEISCIYFFANPKPNSKISGHIATLQSACFYVPIIYIFRNFLLKILDQYITYNTMISNMFMCYDCILLGWSPGHIRHCLSVCPVN